MNFVVRADGDPQAGCRCASGRAWLIPIPGLWTPPMSEVVARSMVQPRFLRSLTFSAIALFSGSYRHLWRDGLLGGPANAR
jgi:hypothetical protein